MNLATGNAVFECDGCKVRFDFSVMWIHDGDGVTVNPNGDVNEKKVGVGDTERFTSPGSIDIGCDSELAYDFISPNGGAQARLGCSPCE